MRGTAPKATFLWGLLLLLTFGLVGVAGAHSNEHLSNERGPHDGMLRAADQFHLELRVDGEELWLWVTDHADTPQPTAGVRGRATVVLAHRSVNIELVPAGDNALRGTHPALRGMGELRVVVTLNVPGSAPVQARFAGKV